MSRKFLRIMAMILAVVMTCAMLACCDGGQEKPTEAPTQQPTEPPTEPQIDYSNVEALGDYVVFGQSYGSTLMYFLVDNLEVMSGKKVKYSSTAFAFEEPKEIILGMNYYYDIYFSEQIVEGDFSRAETDALLEDVKEGQFRIVRKDNADGERIYILADTDVMMIEALQFFITHFVKNSEPIENGYDYTSPTSPHAQAPHVFQDDDGKYYLFGQSKGVKYLVSEDLVNWSNNCDWSNAASINIVTHPSDSSGSYDNVELHKYNGKYYLLAQYGGRNGIALFEGDSITGEFKAVNSVSYVTDAPYTLNFPTFYADETGAYILYVSDWLSNENNRMYRGNVWAIKLSDDLKTADAPIKLFDKSTFRYGDLTQDTECISVYKNHKGDLMILFSDYDSAVKPIRNRNMVIFAARSNDGTLTGKWSIERQPVFMTNIDDGAYLLTLEGLTNGTIVTAPDGSLKLVCSSEYTSGWGQIKVRDLIDDEIDDALYLDMTDSFFIRDKLVYTETDD